MPAPDHPPLREIPEPPEGRLARRPPVRPPWELPCRGVTLRLEDRVREIQRLLAR